MFHPDYVWHPLARTWQTPGDGERLVASIIDLPLADRVRHLHDLGIANPVAERLAAAQEAQMGRAILKLYRSAVQPALVRAGQRLSVAAAVPGLVVYASADDMTGTRAMHHHVAESVGARVAVLEGLGHWWMVQDPPRSAHALSAFWSSLE